MTNYDKMKQVEGVACEVDGLKEEASRVWWRNCGVMTPEEARRLSRIIDDMIALREDIIERSVNIMK